MGEVIGFPMMESNDNNHINLASTADESMIGEALLLQEGVILIPAQY